MEEEKFKTFDEYFEANVPKSESGIVVKKDVEELEYVIATEDYNGCKKGMYIVRNFPVFSYRYSWYTKEAFEAKFKKVTRNDRYTKGLLICKEK